MFNYCYACNERYWLIQANAPITFEINHYIWPAPWVALPESIFSDLRVGEQEGEEGPLRRFRAWQQRPGEDGGERAEGDRLRLVQLVQEHEADQPGAGAVAEQVWKGVNFSKNLSKNL